MNWSLQDFTDAWPIVGDSLLTGGICAAILGWFGVYIVEKRMVFVAATITQTAAAGVAIGFLLNLTFGTSIDPLVTSALVASLAIVLLSRGGETPEDARVGAVFALATALTIAVQSRIVQEAHDIESLLFGSAVLVRPEDLTLVLLVGGPLLAIQLLGFKAFAFASFDPRAARVQGLPVQRLNSALLLSFGLMVGISAHALGAMPVFSFTVLPAIAARRLAGSLGRVLLLSLLLGGLIGAGGYILAFVLDMPVGATQTLFGCTLWGATLLLTRRGS